MNIKDLAEFVEAILADDVMLSQREIDDQILTAARLYIRNRYDELKRTKSLTEAWRQARREAIEEAIGRIVREMA